MVHLEFGLDAPVGGFGVVVGAIQMLYDSIMNIPRLLWKDRWTTATSIWSADIIVLQPVYVTVTDAEMFTCRIACVELGLRRIVPTSSWPRQVGRAELASPNRRRRVVLDLSL